MHHRRMPRRLVFLPVAAALACSACVTARATDPGATAAQLWPGGAELELEAMPSGEPRHALPVQTFAASWSLRPVRGAAVFRPW